MLHYRYSRPLRGTSNSTAIEQCGALFSRLPRAPWRRGRSADGSLSQWAVCRRRLSHFSYEKNERFCKPLPAELSDDSKCKTLTSSKHLQVHVGENSALNPHFSQGLQRVTCDSSAKSSLRSHLTTLRYRNPHDFVYDRQQITHALAMDTYDYKLNEDIWNSEENHLLSDDGSPITTFPSARLTRSPARAGRPNGGSSLSSQAAAHC